ncbi:MAG TPA: imidazoleglycerol-phosphate dehydratase HisB [Phycisphaerales bacterium]|nr:imidazoleglycerol-phosphate dehydratase HisB [Phycisphaerales bacterium]
MTRTATINRKTRETEIALTLCLDGSGSVAVSTGVGFLDHLLTALATHAGFDLSLTCTGDLHVDDHHTAEDCAIALGQAIDSALGDRTGIARFGSAYAPLDEALARGVVDLVTRAHATVNLPLNYDRIGGLACENIPHVLASLATAARLCLHADLIRGDNDHHKAEATFKAVALALKQAVARTGAVGAPSTKGVM